MLAAGLVAAVHLGHLLCMVFGGFLALRWVAWLWPHIMSKVLLHNTGVNAERSETRLRR